MTNLRELAESDLGVTLEGEWGLPVELVGPDGIEYKYSENSPDPENPDLLQGQILYDQLTADPETGEVITVNNPIVSLRRSSLARIPLPGENWIVRIPTVPNSSAAKESFMLSPVKPPGGGGSIGFIKLYLQRIVQIDP